MIKRFFRWVFKSELAELKRQEELLRGEMDRYRYMSHRFVDIFGNIDVSVDVHEYDHRYSPSWAVLSIQGVKTDYIKFVNLGERDIQEISRFLRNFERQTHVKIDATPDTTSFLRIEHEFKGRK